MIKRFTQKAIELKLYQGKAIILYGARQVGKTTLIRELENKYKENALYINCDEPDFRTKLESISSTECSQLFGDKTLILIDEAQRVKNIGLTIKLMVDNFPHIQIIATGSSSLELANEIIEPLTGRKYEFHLMPISLQELNQSSTLIEIDRLLEQRMIFGQYPEIINNPKNAQEHIRFLASSYLYRDVLQYQDIRKPELLDKLLTALALQVGSEVSYNELASLVGVSKQTVESYIQLLEKSFIIFRLNPLSRNLRNELTKMRKIYFFDNGIRNALINNFNPLDLRSDRGALWENFLISERMKHNAHQRNDVNPYFWRTHSQKEIDYIEEYNGAFHGYEIKWNAKNYKFPKIFAETYPNSTLEIIDKTNYQNFIGIS